MTIRRRAAIVILTLLVVLIGASGWLTLSINQKRQQDAALRTAIKNNDIRAVEVLLADGADPNTRYYTHSLPFWTQILDLMLHRPHALSGTPPLELALHYAHLEGNQNEDDILLALIGDGANPNVENMWGETPLLWACRYDDKSLMLEALHRGATVNDTDVSRDTALIWAARTGDPEMVQALLAHGAKVNVADQTIGGDGFSALSAAACNGDLQIMRLLLAHGADVNLRDVLGNTALRWVLTIGSPSCSSAVVKALLTRGADTNMDGGLLLELAADAKRPDLIRLLKQYGAKDNDNP